MLLPCFQGFLTASLLGLWRDDGEGQATLHSGGRGTEGGKKRQSRSKNEESREL